MGRERRDGCVQEVSRPGAGVQRFFGLKNQKCSRLEVKRWEDERRQLQIRADAKLATQLQREEQVRDEESDWEQPHRVFPQPIVRSHRKSEIEVSRSCLLRFKSRVPPNK